MLAHERYREGGSAWEQRVNTTGTDTLPRALGALDSLWLLIPDVSGKMILNGLEYCELSFAAFMLAAPAIRSSSSQVQQSGAQVCARWPTLRHTRRVMAWVGAPSTGDEGDTNPNAPTHLPDHTHDSTEACARAWAAHC